MEITAKTQKVGLLGWPIGHSLSPAMQNAAFAAAGLDYIYLPLPAPPELLADAVAGIKALGFAGANVTIPHKVAVMNYLDEIDNSARLVGAVNTIVVKDGRLLGYNTDAAGFIRSLEAAGTIINGRRAVIFGAGGAARAVVAGFVSNNIATVVIGARDAVKASELAGIFRRQSIDGQIPSVTGCSWDSPGFTAALTEADIVVNSTPLGMHPHTDLQPPLTWTNINSTAVISDIVYNPRTTKFMAEAAQRGFTVIGGEGMLAEQGALAFQLWTGCQAPRDIMRQALLLAIT